MKPPRTNNLEWNLEEIKHPPKSTIVNNQLESFFITKRYGWIQENGCRIETNMMAHNTIYSSIFVVRCRECGGHL